MTQVRSLDRSLNRRAHRIIAVTAVGFAVAGAAFAQSATTPSGQSDAATAAQGVFKRMDANKDGKLSKEEASRNPSVAAKFDAWDTDKDSALSVDEFSAGYTAVK
jgi:Ca2+-binding EF-hand superfamily protein